VRRSGVGPLRERRGSARSQRAIDRSVRRLAEVGSLSERLGLSAAIVCVHMDATLAHERWPQPSFDRVLLDPPCTALGQRPRLSVTTSPDEIAACAAYQKQLLHAAVRPLPEPEP
jgi:16S rRNA C967 or C1407 C5-methylase (RsmB/RsmF family)